MRDSRRDVIVGQSGYRHTSCAVLSSFSFGGLSGSLAVISSVFGSGCTKYSLPAQSRRSDFDVTLHSMALDIVQVSGLYAHPKVLMGYPNRAVMSGLFVQFHVGVFVAL